MTESSKLQKVAEVLHRVCCDRQHPDECAFEIEEAWTDVAHSLWEARATQLYTEIGEMQDRGEL